jgi:hypothetical protein
MDIFDEIKLKARKKVPIEIQFSQPTFAMELTSSVMNKVEAIYHKADKSQKDVADLKWIVLRNGWCYEDGSPVLTNDKRASLEELPTSFVSQIYNPILKLCDFTEDEIDAIEKN